MSINQIDTIDGHAAKVLTFFGNVATFPISFMGNAIRENTTPQNHPVEKGGSILDDAKYISKHIYLAFKTYHEWVMQNASQSSTEVYHGMSTFTKKVLQPITFGQLGQSAQKIFAENFVGNLAQVITFFALQFFHTVPYLIMFAFSSGVYFLYQTAPVALITFLAASILIIQIYLIIELNKTAIWGIKSFEEQSEIVNQSLRSYEPIVATAKIVSGIFLVYVTVSVIQLAKSVFFNS